MTIYAFSILIRPTQVLFYHIISIYVDTRRRSIPHFQNNLHNTLVMSKLIEYHDTMLLLWKNVSRILYNYLFQEFFDHSRNYTHFRDIFSIEKEFFQNSFTRYYN